MFISIEGLDGSGKTTLLKRVFEELQLRGRKVIRTREPGGTPSAEQIRGLLFKLDEISTRTELFLIMAARSDHVETLIRPRLDEGYIVITDRYIDSTHVYQSDIEPEVIDSMHRLATGDLYPDLTILLDADPVALMRRIEDRGGDMTRWDRASLDDQYRSREVFLRRYNSDPSRYLLLDALNPIDVNLTKLINRICP